MQRLLPTPMQRRLPNVAIVAGALITGSVLTYAIGRMVHLYLAGSPAATFKTALAQVLLVCFVVLPPGLLAIAGGFVWKRSNAEALNKRMAEWEIEKKKREKRDGKFAR